MRGADWQPVEAPNVRVALASSGSLNIRERIPTEFVEKIVVDFGRLYNRSTLQMRHSSVASGGQVNRTPSGGVLAGSSAASSSNVQLGPHVQTSQHQSIVRIHLMTQSTISLTRLPRRLLPYIITITEDDALLDGRVIRRVIGRNQRRLMPMVRKLRARLAERIFLRVHCYALTRNVSRSISSTRLTRRLT